MSRHHRTGRSHAIHRGLGRGRLDGSAVLVLDIPVIARPARLEWTTDCGVSVVNHSGAPIRREPGRIPGDGGKTGERSGAHTPSATIDGKRESRSRDGSNPPL